MNSKWIKQSIIAGTVMILMVVLFVFLVNYKSIKRRYGKKPVAATEAVTDPSVEGGQIGSNLSGFMNDDDFFNEKENDSEIMIQTGTKVSIVIDTVGSDMRISLVNPLGKLCTGAEFVVDIEDNGAYVDSDRDGMILISGLESGQYFVSVEDIEGYIVPATKTMVTVDSEIAYKPLNDVEYIIKNETDVDAGVDDIREWIAMEEADGTEIIDASEIDESGSVGIDVSSYNRTIDWAKVAESGVEFAFIRCGYRGATSGELVADSTFRNNMMGAAKAEIPVGVYFFSQAINETEAIEEASMVINSCKIYLLDYPVYIVADSAGGKGRADRLTKEKRTEVVKAFCETVAESGYEVGVYASAKWLEDKLDAEALTPYHVWLAQHSEKVDYDEYYDVWQFTSKGTVEGIETKVALNVCYGKVKLNSLAQD